MLYEQFGAQDEIKVQFVAVVNALASCHVALASRARDSKRRAVEFERAKKYFETAQQIDLLNSGTLVGEAVLLLQQGKLESASSKLESASAYCRGSNKLAAPVLLGRACAKFQAGSYSEALPLCREVFMTNPSPPPAVRLGLAYSAAKLGNVSLARKALERTLALQPDSVEALAGLALLDENEQRVPEALERLTAAYKLEPSHPSVLLQLSSHFFLRGEYDKATALAKRGYAAAEQSARDEPRVAERRRVFHAKSDFSSALQWYMQATKLAPSLLPPYYGLGQMHLVNNDERAALDCFEKVLASSPDNVDALKLAGMLYTRIKPRRDELATQRLTRATELAPLDVVAWLELAKVHESASSLSVALKAYEKAAALLKRAQKLVPVELWNNLGVLRQRLGKLDSAEAAYSAAARLCGGEGASQLAEMQRVTVGYNTARLWEQQGRLEQATAKYVELLQEHPNYVDCFLRLGACEQAVGRPSGALAWLKKGLEVDPVNADLWCALGRVHMEQRDWMRADACFKAVLEKCEGCRKDSYAMLSLANIQLELSAREKHSSRQENALLDKATELYRAVLLQEPNNVFAANGLGVVCAKKGRFAEARSIFTSVRDAS
ncbi:hypothetical protein EMIHUDRAFT_72710, partial [Emiliania huxleyi CCMP1516]|uniref:Uncharacterized protein n=2 Tax=Emiliania huxleyi TaxID=2903 RepID=A0A0D3K2B4_EMIH1